MNLEYKWLCDDLLVFKNKNNCMMISNCNTWSKPMIDEMWADGEELYLEYNEYDWEKHPENPFTKEEVNYYLEFYEEELKLRR